LSVNKLSNNSGLFKGYNHDGTRKHVVAHRVVLLRHLDSIYKQLISKRGSNTQNTFNEDIHSTHINIANVCL
jgi:hypothetical protein